MRAKGKEMKLKLSELLIPERVLDAVEEVGSLSQLPPLHLFYAARDFPLQRRRLLNVLVGMVKDKRRGTTKVPPISVERVSSGRYRVINGRHRVAAAFLLRRKTIRAYAV